VSRTDRAGPEKNIILITIISVNVEITIVFEFENVMRLFSILPLKKHA
jgi:hypothetical protein